MMLIFFFWRLVDSVIACLASLAIPYLGFFPYKEIFADYHLPRFISGLANFDGAQYLLIVREGYNQFTQAYFPIYPLLIKFVSFIVPNHLLSGLLISNLCFLIGLYFFKQYLMREGEETSPLQVIIFLLLFPTSFFFGALYTEGLFFLLTVLVLWGLQQKKYWLVALMGFLAALTRFVGVFLMIPIGIHVLQNQISRPKVDQPLAEKIKNQNYRSKFKNKNNYYLLTPLLGLLSYMLYLWKTTGDALFFFHSQPVFGANRSTHLILLPQVYFRYFKIFLTANIDFRYFVAITEFVVFNFCLIVLICSLVDSWRKLRGTRQRGRQEHWRGKNFRLWLSTNNGLIIFSLINLLLPTLTGTFSSLPRYALMSLSVFIFLGQIKSRRLKLSIATVFLLLHIILLSYFIQGYFVG